MVIGHVLPPIGHFLPQVGHFRAMSGQSMPRHAAHFGSK